MDEKYYEPYCYLKDGKWFCKDCLISTYKLSKRSSLGKLLEFVDRAINEITVQYEQWAGELIPLKGVKCCKCKVELIDAMGDY